MLAETSTSRQQRRFVSSSYCLTYRRSCLAQTFQSTRRRSSPAAYSRCWRNSTDWPKYGLRCMPLRRPSTMCRARISNRPIRLITSGCKDLLEAVVMDQLVFVRGSCFKQAIDNLVGSDAVAFGGEIYDEPVPEHGLGQFANVFKGDVRPAMDERAGFRSENQELR